MPPDKVPVKAQDIKATNTLPVLASPCLLDPGLGRIDLDLPCGMSLAEIVASVLPGLGISADAAGNLPLRVVLVNEQGAMPVEQRNWQFVRPRPGVRVLIRALPGKSAIRTILMIVVTIAAVALGQLWAVPIAGALGISAAVVSAGLTLGLSALGNLLVNALVPPTSANPGDQSGAGGNEVKQSYTITGWKNRLSPDGAVPVALGKHRYAPPFGAISYTEIVGDIQYVRALFLFGYGPLKLSEFKLGTTDLDEYDEIEIETREGLSGDAPLTLYPKQVIEEAVGSDLTRPLPRNDAGTVVSGPANEKPVTRYTAANSTGASVIISFPGGLFHYNSNGKLQSLSVSVRIRYRALQSGDDWTTVTTLNVSAGKREAFYRQHSWEFPKRGRYEVEVTRLTNERTNDREQDRTVFLVLQSLRPEYPLNFDRPLALAALRIKATYQLNNSLDNFSALVSRVCLDWDKAGGSWISRETSNPAALYRFVLQSPANPYPVADSGIDLGFLQDWHEFCAAKGLKFNFVLDRDLTLFEVLQLIAAAGRATPRHDGVKWSVVIDRPQDMVVDHISPRNSDGFKWTRTYLDPPDAFRVPFFDETNEFEPAERVVPWPGFSGEINLTEEIELPGKTNPDEIWIEARRRMYEIIHRPNRYSALQDGAVRVATRGDLIMGSLDVLEKSQVAAHVKRVEGNLIVLDEEIQMEEGADYAVRFRTGICEEDTIGTSSLRSVVFESEPGCVIRVDGGGVLPKAGDIVHFGKASQESKPLIVRGIEAGQDFTSHITFVDAAPEIDALTDAEEPPTWSGVIGSELDDQLSIPARPRFTAIRTGVAGTGSANGLDVLLVPGSGSSATIGRFEIDHRLSGTSPWTSVDVTAAEGGGAISGYEVGDRVQLRARALTPNGLPGPYNAIFSITIGETDAGIPRGLGNGSGVVGGKAHAKVTIVTQNDENVVAVVIYRLASAGVLDREAHVIGTHGVSRSSTLEVIDGDATGEDGALLPAGSYDYYLEPKNEDDVAGPVSGPYTAVIT
ncbi:host specificity factor TipJ family phage tail protein [Roseibium sp. TrichSKD4]|uniref:host specificity factor TipJ family phage tail protein n=1 Tax=Roseibium sp. TrichSKD4 TaxID=744980 RepID=UPI0011120DF5|nr:host specificity factor TipJ family phage tail protein [Roseibium sp. TrichSKD4]